jgi:predicted choloylglycine hydrolase
MNTKDFLLFIFSLLLLVALLFVYMKQPATKPVKSDIEKYKDSIAKLDSQISFQMKKIAVYEKAIDSLNSLPAKIKIKYRDQKASVPSATVTQLDSIIRANAGLPQR